VTHSHQGVPGTTGSLLLLIDPCPASVEYRPLLADDEGEPLFTWCLRRIKDAADGRPVLIPISESEYPLYEPHLRDADVNVILGPPDTEVNTVQRCSSAAAVDAITVVYPECAFAPADLLRQMLATLSGSDTDFAVIDGLPPKMAPMHIRSDALTSIIPFLQALKEFGVPSHSSIRGAVELIAVALRHDPQEQMKLSCRHLLPPYLLEFLKGPVPARLSFEGASQVAIARRALQEEQPARAWAEIEREDRRRRRSTCRGRPAASPSRILYVSDACVFTGAHEALCQMVARLDTNAFEPLALLGMSGHFARRLKDSGCRTIVTPNQSIRSASLDNFDFVMQTLRDLRPDLIHINDFSGMNVAYAASALGIPTIFHVRIPGAQFLRDGLLAADHVIAISESVRRDVLRGGVHPDDISTIHSGIDMDFFSPDPASRSADRSRLGLSDGTCLLTMVGRFHPIKRHDVFVRAVHRLVQDGLRVQAVIIGESDAGHTTYERVVSLVKSLDLVDTVTFRGFESDMRSVYRATDVFVLCSDVEPLGLSALQAMASGTPTVLSTTGGLTELVGDTGAALIAPPGDPGALSRAVRSIIQDNRMAESLADRGRRLVTDQFDSKATARAVEQLYRRLLCEAGDSMHASNRVRGHRSSGAELPTSVV
jgi:glycosyltransferase involved in cell wall biosynthesis